MAIFTKNTISFTRAFNLAMVRTAVKNIADSMPFRKYELVYGKNMNDAVKHGNIILGNEMVYNF